MADQKVSDLVASGSIAPTDNLYLAQGTTPTKCSIGALQSGMTGPFPMVMSGVDPIVANILPGFWQIWNNTTNGTVKLWCNVSGVLLSVSLE